MATFALIAAAGNGARFSADRPKQYALIAGRPVVAHALDAIGAVFDSERTLVLLAQDDALYESVVGERPRVAALRCGGATRAATVRNGLSMLAGLARDDDWVLVHDAVRPCVDATSLARLRDALRDEPVGALLAVPVTATLKRDDARGRTRRTESRDGLWAAQTPQVFRYRVLREALANADVGSVTDEAQAVEALGLTARLVEGSPTNLKLTYAADLVLAEAIMAMEASRRSVAPAKAGAQRR